MNARTRLVNSSGEVPSLSRHATRSSVGTSRTSSGSPHATEADVAHAGVDRLGSPRRGSVAQAVGVGAQVGAALDDLAPDARSRAFRLTLAATLRLHVTVVTKQPSAERVSWAVLVHRVPREPSTPRIAIWRRLRALGVAQLGDGVVALPEDARTREHLEWVADRVLEARGTALLLSAQTFTRRDEQTIARGMAAARADEYEQVRAKAEEAGPDDGVRTLRRLRKELRGIQRRDYFPPAQRDHAVTAVTALAARLEHATPATAPAAPAFAEGGRP